MVEQPRPDPGNSPPDEWSREMTEDEAVEAAQDERINWPPPPQEES